MAIGDEYRCNTCKKEYTAACTLDTEQCKNATCAAHDVVIIKVKSPDTEVSLLDGLEKKEEPKDDLIDEALHRLKFKDSSNDITVSRKEEKKMAKEQQEGWSGTSPDEYNPENDLAIMLRDLGLKNKIKTIVKMFFQGDTDSPAWLDKCLRMANIDVPRRRLTIAGYFGHVPAELNLGTGDDDMSEDNNKKQKPSADPIKDAYAQIKQKKAEKLLEMTADMEIEELEAKIEKKRERMDSKDSNTKSEIVRIPATDTDGNILKDEKGSPVIMEIAKSDLPYYLLTKGEKKPKDSGDSMLKDLYVQSQKQINELQIKMIDIVKESGKPDEKAAEKATAEKKYWEEKADRERKDREEQMKQYQKERDEFIKQLYAMREDYMKKDMTELVETVKALNKPIEQQMSELQNKGVMAQKFGLIATGADPKTAVQTELARGFGQEGTALLKEVREAARQGMQEGMAMVKEERNKGKGGSPPPEVSVTPDDKEALYNKIMIKMEEEKKHLDEERVRISEAKSELDKKSDELMKKWESMGAPTQPAPQPQPTPPKEEPKSIEETAKEIGGVPAEPPKQEQPAESPKVEDPVDKKLRELEQKGA